MSNFWDIVWLILSTFVFIAYLLIPFQIVADLFRDPDLGGGSKALWLIGLIFVPMFTALVYVVARGNGMAIRQRAAIEQEDLQATVAQRQGQCTADHTGTDNQQICAHFHALRQPRLRLEPHV